LKADLWRRESGQKSLTSSFPDGSKKAIWIELQGTPSTILIINKAGTLGRIIIEANSCQGNLIKVLLRE
jgi:hypothetical protein